MTNLILPKPNATNEGDDIFLSALNMAEEEWDKEDTEMVLRTFLETELGFDDAVNVEIQRVHQVHRLGKKE